MSRSKLGIAGLGLAAVFFLALNVFSSAVLRDTRLDLTEDQLFTLSDGTREVLGSLVEPVKLRLFVSPALLRANPAFASYAARVQELLERYVSLSRGKLSLEIINPEPFTPSEDRAIGFGMQGVPIDQGGDKVYFGLAGTNTTDDTDTVPFLSTERESFLEYDLTRLIHNLANPDKTVIGLIAGNSMEADPTAQYKPWKVVEQMRQFFEVESIIEYEKVTTDRLDVLMVVHPQGLSADMRYAIDQFVLNGGNALIMVDPISEEVTRTSAAQRQPPDAGSDLPQLFKAWGISYDKSKFVGDRLTAQRVSAEGADGQQAIVDFLAWQNLNAKYLNQDDVVTGELEIVNFGSPGAIAKAEGATITLEPLAQTSATSMMIDAGKLRLQPDPAGLLKDFKADDTVRILAARVSGKVKTGFPGGPPKPKAGDKSDETAAKRNKAHLSESKGDINLIVIADTDLLGDRFWLQVQDFFGRRMVVPNANNGDFIINALDNLSGSGGLISLRGRGLSSRPFTLVNDIRKNAEIKYRDREQSLMRKIEDTQKKLKDIETTERSKGAAILSPEQRKAIDAFRDDIGGARLELREVQAALRADIERLDGWLKAINIGAVPLLVLIVAIVLALMRQARYRRHRFGNG